jgi:hypothetical protein
MAGVERKQRAVVLMSGTSAQFLEAPYAAVRTINAAIVALAKAFSDRASPTASRSTAFCRARS